MIIASYLFSNIETNIRGSSSVGLFTPSGPVRMTDFAHEAARYRPSTCDPRHAAHIYFAAGRESECEPENDSSLSSAG
jgi:hypothetical protein